MAELTNLENKVAEVLGLAQAAQGATDTVKGMFDDEGSSLVTRLTRMHDEAVETEERCTEVAGSLDGKKTAILEKAREVKGEATEMMGTYLAGEDDPLDGFEFLTMAEAGDPHPGAPLRRGARRLPRAGHRGGPQRDRGVAAEPTARQARLARSATTSRAPGGPWPFPSWTPSPLATRAPSSGSTDAQ